MPRTMTKPKTTRSKTGLISGPVLPKLKRRRSPEQAARIATKRYLLELVQALETRRAELGLSRSAIARQLGVAQPMISRLFSGQIENVELKTMIRVADALDADLELSIRPRA